MHAALVCGILYHELSLLRAVQNKQRVKCFPTQGILLAAAQKALALLPIQLLLLLVIAMYHAFFENSGVAELHEGERAGFSELPDKIIQQCSVLCKKHRKCFIRQTNAHHLDLLILSRVDGRDHAAADFGQLAVKRWLRNALPLHLRVPRTHNYHIALPYFCSHRRRCLRSRPL